MSLISLIFSPFLLKSPEERGKNTQKKQKHEKNCKRCKEHIEETPILGIEIKDVVKVGNLGIEIKDVAKVGNL